MSRLEIRDILCFATALAFLVTGACTTAQAQSTGFNLTLLPSSPITFDQIIARIATTPSCQIDPQTVGIRQSGSTIRIDVNPSPPSAGCVPVGGSSQDISVGRFPPGTFNVEIYAVVDATGRRLVSSGTFSVTDIYATKTVPFPLVDFSDFWWSPPESGWALNVIQHPDGVVFITWFVYNQAGQPVWYTLQPGQWLKTLTCCAYTGPIYKTTGPYYGGPFDPNQVGIALVGTGTIAFTTYATGIFTYMAEGVQGMKAITRFPF
jgi:hypothetical protein